MHETTNKTLTSLALLPLALLAGCLSDSSAVAIQGFSTVQVTDGICAPTNAGIVQGVMDTTRTLGTASRGYFVTVSLANAMASNADLEAGRVDTNTVFLDTLEVSYRTSAGAAFAAPPAESIPVSVVIPAGGTAEAVVPLVLGTTTEGLLNGASGGFLIAELNFKGKTQDGASAFASAAEFPIQLCDGCLGAPCGTGEQVAALCSIAQNEGVTCESAAP